MGEESYLDTQCYYWLQTDDLDQFVCVRDDELALCGDRQSAEQFSEEMIEFAQPVAEVQFVIINGI
jgi:hypothetical protein